MMENKIMCNIRENSSKGDNHRLRNNGKVPGIIYGLYQNSTNVELEEAEFTHTLAEIGEHGVVEIDTNGNCEKVMIKEIQREPITRRLMHVDLQRIDTNKKIHTHVPILITGEKTLKNKEAVVQRQMDDIEIECVPENIPKFFSIDVSNMSPGQRITYADIELSGEISIVGDINTIVATVTKRKANIQNDDELNLNDEINNVSKNS